MIDSMSSCVLAAFICFVVGAQSAQGASITFESKDVSRGTITLGAGGEFIWVNPDGSMVMLRGPGSMTYTDKKDKHLGMTITPSDIASLADADYGNSGEPPIALSGAITGGHGDFVLDFVGFPDIEDTTASFSATLIGSGSDNPIDALVFGQGDQLLPPKNGSITYTTRWRSTDIVTLMTRGTSTPFGTLAIGDFLLASTGLMDAFTTSVSVSPEVSASLQFTSDERYLFVRDAMLPASGNNLRFTLDSTVTKDVTVPEPASLSLLIVGVTGFVSRRALKARRLQHRSKFRRGL
jgi:hypothetical protein